MGPDLGPNYLQRYQQMTKGAASKETVKAHGCYINMLFSEHK